MKKPLLPSLTNLSFFLLISHFLILPEVVDTHNPSLLYAQSPSKGVFDCDSIGWSSDPSVNLNISSWGQNPHAVSDGKGGVYALWNANSWTTSQYLQYVDRCGIIRWPVPLEIRGEKNGTSYFPSLSEDGAGGVLISFTEWQVSGQYPEEARVRVNRVDSMGSLLWGPYGVRVTTSEEYQFAVSKVVSDGEGGAIVTFGIPDDSLYIQRISASGQRLWGDEGIMITDTSNLNFDHILVLDGSGGAIVEWYGYDTGFKRFDSQGSELWHTPSPQRTLYYSRMLPDSKGGAVLSGTEPSGYRSVIANRISPDGSFLWGNMGIILSDSVGLSQNAGINIALQSNGEATFVWTEQEELFNIFTQRLTNYGIPVWNENLKVSINQGERWGTQIIQSNNYGNIYVWYDFRNGSEANLYAQKIDSSGNRIWSSDDIPVNLNRTTEFKIISDLRDGIIVVWSDAPLNGIFVQQVSKNGDLGEIITSLTQQLDDKIPHDHILFQNYPNPFNSSTIIRIQLAKANDVTLRIYNLVGEEINSLLNEKAMPGMYQVVWKGDDYLGKPVASGVYICRLKAGKSSIVKKLILIR